MPSRMREMIPTACDGRKCWTGKRKPVTLVATVVVRNRVVQPSDRFDVRNPYSTTSPDAIPTRLMITWNKVNALNNIVFSLLVECALSGLQQASQDKTIFSYRLGV